MIAGGQGAETDVEIFDIERNECLEMPPLPYPLWGMATLRRNDTMLLIGGMESKGKVIRSEILEYGFESGQSNVEIVMKTNRVGCTALCHRNSLVLIGGAGGVGDVRGAVDFFNFSSRTWKKLPSMICGRFFPAAVIVKNANFEDF